MKCFRKNEDRIMPYKVKLIKWNTLMDLIAIGMKNGDVSIHRLVNWQRIWVLSWPGRSVDGDKFEITAMEWRPDGKVLAVGYNRNVKNLDSSEESSTALIDLENGQVIDVIVIENSSVTSLCWQTKFDFELDDKFKSNTITDSLPRIPPLNKSHSNSYSRKFTEEGIEDLMKVATQNNLNVLAIGTNGRKIYFYCFGVFLAGILNLKENESTEYIALSSDLGLLTALVVEKQPAQDSPGKVSYSLKSYKLPSFRDFSGQYFMLSHLNAKISSILSYLEDIMGALQENMEEMLLELDSKLSNLQTKQSANSSDTILLADELLELLVVGTMPDELEKFLNQLTDKGLKKLGHSIETLYSNIQKLVVCNVQRSCERVFCYLHTLKSMALWESEFSVVGMNAENINRSLHAVASFYFKSLELQQVIDSSSQNVKCFFRWLYTVTCRLSNDSLPPNESNKLSEQDLHHVADFIEENFDYNESRLDPETTDSPHNTRPTATNFTLERVAQYLRPEHLVYRTFSSNETGLNPWFKYLKERPMLIMNGDDSNLILYRFNPETSLIGEYKSLIKTIDEAFKTPSHKMTQLLSETTASESEPHLIFENLEGLKITHLSDPTHKQVTIGICRNDERILETSLLTFSFDPQASSDSYFVSFKLLMNEDGEPVITRPLDIQFYNEGILSMVVQACKSKSSFLVQFPMKLVAEKVFKIESLQTLESLSVEPDVLNLKIIPPADELSFRKLDDLRPLFLAVSGSRRVSCIVSRKQRRLRIFEMDANDEDDAEEDEK
ncbi:anaphase-promoting complex subunit 4 [Brevipalpus obovatus]|uniref:anaphase-promoting complex subunit 4 n=1 Tax=Brevipalpus obovatus TaxID=246614 RepID=UPI003D9EFA0A